MNKSIFTCEQLKARRGSSAIHTYIHTFALFWSGSSAEYSKAFLLCVCLKHQFVSFWSEWISLYWTWQNFSDRKLSDSENFWFRVNSHLHYEKYSWPFLHTPYIFQWDSINLISYWQLVVLLTAVPRVPTKAGHDLSTPKHFWRGIWHFQKWF